MVDCPKRLAFCPATNPSLEAISFQFGKEKNKLVGVFKICAIEENVGKTLHMLECSTVLSLDDKEYHEIKLSKFSFFLPRATPYVLGSLEATHTILLLENWTFPVQESGTSASEPVWFSVCWLPVKSRSFMLLYLI